MMSGRGEAGRKYSFVTDTFEAMARYKAGVIDAQELQVCEDNACPGMGSCQGLFTANTMAILTETLGMSLPRCGTAWQYPPEAPHCLCLGRAHRRSGERQCDTAQHPHPGSI